MGLVDSDRGSSDSDRPLGVVAVTRGPLVAVVVAVIALAVVVAVTAWGDRWL
jgi:hypothetical protein